MMAQEFDLMQSPRDPTVANYFLKSLFAGITGPIAWILVDKTGSDIADLAARSITSLTGTLAAAQFPALTTDVTTSAGSLATTIAAQAVTYAKIQNISATGVLLGRKTAGAGSTEEITPAGDVTLSGSTFTVGTHTSWTPADNSGASLSFTSVSANYTKIGNMIFAYAVWTYPVTASGANASISGLPVTVANANYAQVPAIVDTSASITGGLVMVPVKNTTTATLDVGTPFGPATNLQLSTATIAVMLIYPAA